MAAMHSSLIIKCQTDCSLLTPSYDSNPELLHSADIYISVFLDRLLVRYRNVSC